MAALGLCRELMVCISVLVSDHMKNVSSISLTTLAVLALTSAYAQEAVKPLGAEWANFEMITGFHHAFDEHRRFEVRLLESDASATVALNPVSIYIVITNNLSGADLQQYVWMLPSRVRAVKGIKLAGSTLRIKTEVDADPYDSSKSAERDLTVQYDISDGVLKDTLLIEER
jgi:hypothetical protein